MQFDYFYGSQAEQFSFYRIPKVLFTDPQFKPLSTDAKVLYGILLDRMSLSVKNHWLDEQSLHHRGNHGGPELCQPEGLPPDARAGKGCRAH